MKKIVVAVVLLLALLTAGLFTGVAKAGGGLGLTVTPGCGPAGTQVTLVGWGWNPGQVQIFLDSKDDVNLLAQPMAVGTNGASGFRVTFEMTATTVGGHTIWAVQGSTQKSGSFWLTVTDPVDARINSEIQNIEDGIQTLENRLTDARAANLDLLPGIKTKVDDIKSELQTLESEYTAARANNLDILPGIRNNLNDPGHGLNAIATKLDNLQIDLDSSLASIAGTLADIKSGMSNMHMDVDSGWYDAMVIGAPVEVIVYKFPGIRHVSIMLDESHPGPFDWVEVDRRNPSDPNNNGWIKWDRWQDPFGGSHDNKLMECDCSGVAIVAYQDVAIGTVHVDWVITETYPDGN